MDQSRPTKLPKISGLVDKFISSRRNTAESVATFQFNKKRTRLLTSSNDVPIDSKGILYWMFRDARVQDNWALLFAQKVALKNSLPLHICFCILPTFLDSTIRHYKFLVKGLKEVEEECKRLNISFHLFHGEPSATIPQFVKEFKMGAVVVDFFPLKLPMSWLEDLKKTIPQDIPICQVDAHNIVPCWQASSKLEFSARTIRNKINSQLDEFLTEFPPVIKHKYITDKTFENNDWDAALENVEVDKTVDEITWAVPGYNYGIKELESFLKNRLKNYEKRNDPLEDACSNLSPWIHFGMISVQRCILEVKTYERTYPKAVQSFMEQCIVRRELTDNFCFYNKDYDLIKGASNWAIKTLNDHRKDKREHIYTLHELEDSLTHDDLWNASQNQMVVHGKMHTFLRMYWAKKILEWTETPEQALEWANYLNNRYNIDGCDPNGYVGCSWSICGVHDHGWGERPVFGKIRYMNYNGCMRKFDVRMFVVKWGKKQKDGDKQKRTK